MSERSPSEIANLKSEITTVPARALTKGDNLINYETSHLEKIAQTLPDNIREDFLWLGGCIVNEYGRNLEALERRLKELGLETTASTISKIMRGRWQVDSYGRKLDAPVMKLRNFQQLVDKLRAYSQTNSVAGAVPFVPTATWELIRDYIDARSQISRICKFGVIIGPTGSQKTHCLKQYRTEHNHGQTIWIESPARGTFSQFITDLANAYQIPTYISLPKKEIRIRDCVNYRKVIIVDNIQRLYRSEDGGNQTIFNYLQKLQDETQCTVILSAAAEFKGSFLAGAERAYFEQFVGRCGGQRGFLELPPYTPREDLIQIAEAFGFTHADRHAAYLEHLSRQPGRIRVYFQALQDARQIADSAGEKLQLPHLQAALGEEV